MITVSLLDVIYLFKQYLIWAPSSSEQRTVKLYLLQTLINFIQYIIIMWRYDLAPVSPIHLITIVFLGVVGGSHHDTGDGVVQDGAEGDQRCGADLGEHVHRDR